MGACASRPKDLKKKGAPLPSEAPLSPRKPDAVDPALQENKDEGAETKKEEPLVDVPEVTAPEATTKVEEAAADAEAVQVEEKAAVKEEVVADETQDKTQESSNVKL